MYCPPGMFCPEPAIPFADKFQLEQMGFDYVGSNDGTHFFCLNNYTVVKCGTEDLNMALLSNAFNGRDDIPFNSITELVNLLINFDSGVAVSYLREGKINKLLA